MGGPATSVVFPRVLEPDEISNVTAVLTRRGWTGDWNVVTDQPLGFSFGAQGEQDWEWSYANDDEPGDLGDAFKRVVGWHPVSELALVSFVSSEEGHRAIADAAIEFSRSLGGLVHLGGDVDAPADLPGIRFHLPYVTVPGELADDWVVDAEWLTAWRLEPTFQMVK